MAELKTYAGYCYFDLNTESEILSQCILGIRNLDLEAALSTIQGLKLNQAVNFILRTEQMETYNKVGLDMNSSFMYNNP